MKKLNYISHRPWGSFYDLAEEKGKWHLKIIKIKKGQRLSLQRHKLRKEYLIAVEGKIRVQKGFKKLLLKVGDSISIKRNGIHRLEAITDAFIVEVSFGIYKEKDIIRLSDDYGRA